MAVENIKKREESPEVHRAAAWCDFIFYRGNLSRQILGDYTWIVHYYVGLGQ